MTPTPTAQRAADEHGSLPDPHFTHILVPLDGSDLAVAAMATARVLAERFGAELQTISVTDDGPDEVDRLLGVGARALGTEILDGRAVVVEGDDPAKKIAHRAQQLGSCLVCMSTHGRGRLAGALMGSVATALLLEARDPIVAVGPLAERPLWLHSPREPDPLSELRVVACVDGSTASEEILPVAWTWARALGMSLTIATVAEDAPAPLRPDRESGPYADAGSPQQYINDLVERWTADQPSVEGHVVRDPIGAASGMRAYLAERPAGLLALRTNARTGIERVRLGATAAQIIHASTIPCLVVPPPR